MSGIATEQDPTQLRLQFETNGHVYVPNVYDPNQSAQLLSEIDLLMRWSRPKFSENAGGQTRQIEKPNLSHPRPGAIDRVIGAVGAIASDTLGFGSWQSLADYLCFEVLSTIPFITTKISGETDSEPANGRWHYDRADLDGLVVITTPSGNSELYFRDGSHYEISAGGAVFFRHDLSHKGRAPESRTSMIISKLTK